MNLNIPIDKKTMEIIRATPKDSARPLTFEIPIPLKELEHPKAITPEEANRMFGPSLAVKMNFIPQMIIAMALDYVTEFVNYCRENKIKEFRKHNRLLLLCVDEYRANLRKSYGEAYYAYSNYMERYFEYVESDRYKMLWSIGNVVNRHVKIDQGREMLKYIIIIHRLLDYAEKYEKKMDVVIAEKIKAPVRRSQDKLLTLVTAMCIEFEHIYNFKTEYNDIIETSIAVMSNRAANLADFIIDEESKCQ